MIINNTHDLEFTKIINTLDKLNNLLENDCSISSLVTLSELIYYIRAYFYVCDQKHTWEKLISEILNQKIKPSSITSLELQQNFNLNCQNEDQLSQLCCLIIRVDQFISQYNLSLRDLIRMSHISAIEYKII
jgi:hypothetical protein